MKRVLLVAGVWLGLAGSAQGAPYEPGPAMQRWQQIASERFPGACGPVVIEASDEQPGELGAWADLDSCTITLYPAYWGESRVHRCSLLVHEYGHLAGVAHSTDPFDVMYPGAPAFRVRPCWRRYPTVR